MEFGEMVVQQRSKLKMTLRQFCRLANLDASNWSKTERGRKTPPQGKEKLMKIAEILEIKDDINLLEGFLDSAKIAASKLPDFVNNNKELKKMLPVYLRALDSTKLNKKELLKVINIIRGVK